MPDGSFAGFLSRPASYFPINDLEFLYQLNLATYDFNDGI